MKGRFFMRADMILFDLKRNIRTMLIWAVAIGAVLSIYLFFFPTMQTNQNYIKLFQGELEMMPDQVLAMFNMDDMVDFSNLLNYYGYISNIIFIASCIYACVLGAGALAKEEGNKTIEFLYTMPLTRKQILINKLITSFIILFLFTFISSIITMFSAVIVKPSTMALFDLIIPMMKVIGYQFLIMTGFMFLSFGFSAVLKKTSIIAPIGMVIFFVTYISGVFGKTIKSLKFLKYFSPYYFIESNKVIKNGYFNPYYLLILAFMIFGGFVFAYFYYSKKDFKI